MDASSFVGQVWARTRTSLPLPGSGQTLARFEALAEVAGIDLSLAKLVEPHYDSSAILAELSRPPPQHDELWAVWAAEPPYAQLQATLTPEGWRLDGTKAFCSGAEAVTHALVTATAEDGPRLFAVAILTGRNDGSITVQPADWTGAGMRQAGTRSLKMRALHAEAVGDPGAYVDRPGFWHGAVGVAACWLGGTRAVADLVVRRGRERGLDDHAAAHLGAMVAALDATGAQLQHTAARIDADPADRHGTARRDAQSFRATALATAEFVMRRTARALGPAPLAFDREHGQRVADLEMFIRQHHGERDLAELGRLEIARKSSDETSG